MLVMYFKLTIGCVVVEGVSTFMYRGNQRVCKQWGVKVDSIGGGNPKIWCGSAAKEMAHLQRSPQKNERIIEDPKRNVNFDVQGSVCWVQRPVSKDIQIHPKLT